MTRTEHLLIIASEECIEIALAMAQRTSKALRFSLLEVQPAQPFTNAERIMAEFDDLVAVVEMLQHEGILPASSNERVDAKKRKVEEFLLFSAEQGTLQP